MNGGHYFLPESINIMNSKNKSIFDSGAGFILLVIGLLTSVIIANDMKQQHFYKNKFEEIIQLKDEDSENDTFENVLSESRSSVLYSNFLQQYISNTYHTKDRESIDEQDNSPAFLISQLKSAVIWVDQQKERAANRP
jgi:hypothetical protein